MLEFLSSFELVFETDWQFARECLCDDHQYLYIDPDGTFLHPRVEHESNNWANRGALLEDYRKLVAKLDQEGVIKRDRRE